MFLPSRLVVLGVALTVVACGSNGPGVPTPSPSPLPPRLGGIVSGAYVLEIQAGPDCPMHRGPLSFSMTAAAAGTLPHPGNQVVLEGTPAAFELELEHTGVTLRGGFGTTGEGVLSSEGLRLWSSLVGTGTVTQASDGRGEVVTGTLIGYLALGFGQGEEGSLGTCTALDHTFTLRAR